VIPLSIPNWLGRQGNTGQRKLAVPVVPVYIEKRNIFWATAVFEA